MSVYAWVGLAVVVVLAAVFVAWLVSAFTRPKGAVRLEPSRIFAPISPAEEIGQAALRMRAAAEQAGASRWAERVIDRRASRFETEIAGDFGPTLPPPPPSATSAQSGTPPTP